MNLNIITEEIFYNGRFLDITLLQIFLFLAVPYMILYFYKLSTEFDYFSEKWEGALFIFFFGFLSYIFTIIIYKFITKIILSYMLSLFLIIVILILMWFIIIKPQKGKNNSFVLKRKVLLKNGDNYYGIISRDEGFILVRNEKGIEKYNNSEKKEEKLDYKILGFKEEDVDKLLLK